MSARLSQRQNEVAELVARGMTNREIAESLSISERTAEGHVQGIFDKLGIGSRAQIAAWVVQRTIDRRAEPATPKRRDREVGRPGLTVLMAEHRAEPAPPRLTQTFSRLVAANGGVAVQPMGLDRPAVAVFKEASDAAACALAVQDAVAEDAGPSGSGELLRAALHAESGASGPQPKGPTLQRCARLLEAAHFGQVLVSGAGHRLLSSTQPPVAQTWDLGLHRLRDLSGPERVFQLVNPNNPLSFPRIMTLDESLTNLPLQLTSFVGREEELAELNELRRTNRSITLVGAGGCGKTRLALQLGADSVGDYHDGAWLVDLAPVSDPRLVPQAVASGLSVRERADQALEETLVEHCQARNLLLVLDNCEHLVQPVAVLAEKLARGCPRLWLLATSREPLGIPGELTWRVPPLPVPDAAEPGSIADNESVRLFVDRARTTRPDFDLTADNTRAVARLCRSMDGIPLAIELAAAWTHMLSPDEVVERFHKSPASLASQVRTASRRQRTLTAVVDWSHELLDGDERCLFRRLSVFAGGFRAGDAEAVCSGDPLRQEDVFWLLSRLVTKSLVQPEESRYRFLEPIRAYARARLHESAELDAVASRHAADLLLLARDRGRGSIVAWLDRLEQEHDNLRAALDWSLAQRPGLGLDLAEALWDFWQLRGHMVEARQVLEALLVRIPGRSIERARALLLRAWVSVLQGDAGGQGAIDEAMEIARELNATEQIASALRMASRLQLYGGDPAGAEASLTEALELIRGSPRTPLEALLYYELGLAVGTRGDIEAAQAHWERSLDVWTALGARDLGYINLTFMAGTSILQGDLDTARRHTRESLVIGKRLGDRRAAWALDVSAVLAANVSEPTRVLKLSAAAEAMHESAGTSRPAIWTAYLTPAFEAARERLGAHRADRAWSEGRAMTFDKALDYALEEPG